MEYLNFLFPGNCKGCGRPLVRGERHLCAECVAAIETPVMMPSEMMRRFPGAPIVERHYSLFTYRHDDPLSTMVREGKYNNRPEVLITLARLLAAELMTHKALADVDALVPVPMHWWKQIRRGYNQTHYIARELSRVTSIPVVKALRAVRPHTRLAGASHTARAKAVEGLFEPVRSGVLNGLRVAIVDDVLTSGSTLTAAAGAVKMAGATSVVTLTLGVTPPSASTE